MVMPAMASAQAYYSNSFTYAPSYSSSCSVLSRNLGIGSQGSDVAALQQELQSLGFVINDAYAAYGVSTASAVTGFQEQNATDILAPMGLVHGNGYAGPGTRAKLNSIFGCGNNQNLYYGYPYITEYLAPNYYGSIYGSGYNGYYGSGYYGANYASPPTILGY